MPAKSTKRATASRPRSTTTKSKQVTSNKVNVKRVFIIVSVISIIGAFFIFRASAATTNFEAENASKNNLVVAGSDSTASNGQFVEFAQPTTTTTNTTSTQRFPGDPNPLKTGKAYWGAAIQGNGDPARHETPTGKSLSVRRTYFAWDGRQKMIDTAKADLAANRIPFISTKTPGWAEMASGKRDAEIDDTLRKLDALGGPVWFVVHHEPEGGCNDSCKGPKGEDDAAGAAGWLAMQKKIRERMNVVGTKNVAFVSNLMAWTFDSRSGRNPNDWWAEGVWDVYSADAYCDGSTCLWVNGHLLRSAVNPILSALSVLSPVPERGRGIRGCDAGVLGTADPACAFAARRRARQWSDCRRIQLAAGGFGRAHPRAS